MRWIGWIIALAIILLLVNADKAANREVAAAQAAADAELAETQATVDKKFEAQERRIKDLEGELATAAAGLAKAEARRDELVKQQQELEARHDELDTEQGQLIQRKDQLLNRKDNNREAMAELQKKIQHEEKQIKILKKYLTTVTLNSP